MDCLTGPAQSPSSESVYVPPPGAGIGPGAPPPSSVASMPNAMSAQALQASPGPAGPAKPAKALVDHNASASRQIPIQC